MATTCSEHTVVVAVASRLVAGLRKVTSGQGTFLQSSKFSLFREDFFTKSWYE
jgi:hypothetical protein